MESKFHGANVAVYEARGFGKPAPKVSEFSYKGHAIQKPVPAGMTFSEYLELKTDDGVVCLGHRPDDGWVLVTSNPMGLPGEKCTWGRSPLFILDVIP